MRTYVPLLLTEDLLFAGTDRTTRTYYPYFTSYLFPPGNYIPLSFGPGRPGMTPFHVRWSGIYIYMYIHDTYDHELIHCLSWNIQHLWHKERCTTNCTVILGEVYCCLQLTVYCMQHGPSDPARRRFGRLYFCPAHLGSGTNRADRKIPYGRYGPGPVRPHSCSTSTRAFVHTIHITYAGTQNRPLSERENCVIDWQ